jgi:hypothetical protein
MGQQVFACDAGLSGRKVGIRFPDINPSLSTLYKVRFANGEEHVKILKPGQDDWTVPAAENRFGVAKEYTLLGIEHIWAGIDHLLFVACLLFVAQTPRRLLITITGFTVAHSITLALSTLDVVRIATPPVEAVIALSVVFLAWEIAKQDDASLAYRFPVAVSASFGLLHGFGFAAVLRDIGMPQTRSDSVRPGVTRRIFRSAAGTGAPAQDAERSGDPLGVADGAGQLRNWQYRDLLDDRPCRRVLVGGVALIHFSY